MSNCVFCSIIDGKIPSDKVYEDDLCVIFKDIDPKANKHYLAVPKNHYPTLDALSADDENNIGKILKTISALQEKLGLGEGYRLVINQGANAGQTVFHLHIHILGGQELPFDDLRRL